MEGVWNLHERDDAQRIEQRRIFGTCADASSQVFEIAGVQRETIRCTVPVTVNVDLKSPPIANAFPGKVKRQAGLDGDDVEDDARRQAIAKVQAHRSVEAGVCSCQFCRAG